MKSAIDRLKKTRIFLLGLIEDLTTEQMNEIPDGFNNNIIWNLGHLIASQQGMCYTRSGLTPVAEEQFIIPYKAQTKPTVFVSEGEIKTIKKISVSVLEQLEEDYNSQLFSNYEAFNTRYDISITNIDDAIRFLLFHEGLHMGYIIAMKKNIHK